MSSKQQEAVGDGWTTEDFFPKVKREDPGYS
jgi:hypothetical protein